MTDSYRKYKKNSIVKMQIDIYRSTEDDILKWMEENKPLATKIKAMIREDIAKKNNNK